jgi:hypothetical protein
VPKIFQGQSSQTTFHPKQGRLVQVDKPYYTALTDQLLDHFYPKTCCGVRLSEVDGLRATVLRCAKCHRQQTRLSGTPLNHLKVPRWMFGYLLKESQLQFPKVLTSAEIGRRVGVSGKTAILLKRRIQLFAMDILPRMQRKFYQDNKLMFHDFRFPKDRAADLTAIVKDKPIPQADTVVLYSCSSTANKGRKRYKRTGQTASIYMSESLGGKQRGTLVNTLGVKQGPVFYDSVPNQKAETINPILGKYIPIHTPLFTDEGYRGYPGMNLRTVNHSRKSSDKRYKWSRNRWSKNGIHCNVAEGNNGKIKQAFSTYRWIDPKHSKLYTGEFSVLGNLRYFALDDLLPASTTRKPSPIYKLDENWELRGMSASMCPKGDLNPHGVAPTST